MSFKQQISYKTIQGGGRGSKHPKFSRHHNWKLPKKEEREGGGEEATGKNHHRHRQAVIDTYSDIRSLRQHPRE